MDHDPNRRGHLPSRGPLMRLFGSPVQEILCATSLVFVRPARKNQVFTYAVSRGKFSLGPPLAKSPLRPPLAKGGTGGFA